MIEERRGLPRGSNVGTQLRARRAKRARELRSREAESATTATDPGFANNVGQLALPSAEGWFAAQGWQPFPFQREVWQHIALGRSGLLHATTGSGKTYAVWFGLLNRALAGEVQGGGLRLLWLTPMRALAADIARALEAPLLQFGLDWSVGVRTGDTESSERARQSQRLPEALVTTPESLTLLLARADSPSLLDGVELIVVDEWHELMGTKRGVQLQLALARLRRFARERAKPGMPAPRLAAGQGGGGLEGGDGPKSQAELAVWGLSATLGNIEHAMEVLLAGSAGVMVRGAVPKEIVVDTLLPDEPGRFPWGGHLGIQMLEPVVRGDRKCLDDPRVHQYTLAGGDLVPVVARGEAEVGRRDRVASRLARQGSARVGRTRAQGRAIEGGGRHLQPRPRGRLPAGRARAADRQSRKAWRDCCSGPDAADMRPGARRA